MMFDELKQALDNIEKNKYKEVTAEALKEKNKVDTAKAAWLEAQQMAAVVINDAELIEELILDAKRNGAKLSDAIITKIEAQEAKLSIIQNHISQKCTDYCSALMTSSALDNDLFAASKERAKSESHVSGSIIAKIIQARQKIAKAAGFSIKIFE